MAAFNGDFGFVGGAYTAPDPYQDRQRCVNFYCEIAASAYAKGEDQGKTAVSAGSVIALLGCPGLVQVASVVGL